MFFLQLVSCQNKKGNSMKNNMREWAPAVSSPTEDKLSIMLIDSEITTFEGNTGSVGFGTSNPVWGWGQHPYQMRGTPHKTEIIYYALAEDKFYKVDIEFDETKMREYMSRWYQRFESPDYEGHYITNLNDDSQTNYIRFKKLIFGFAPKGMVVVWAGFGPTRIEIGRYQAVEIKGDTSEYEKEMRRLWASPRSDLKTRWYVPNLSSEKWDKYRRRYNIRLNYLSENQNFRLFRTHYECYNGESEYLYRLHVLNEAGKSRALPNRIDIDWETSKNEKYRGRILFDEDKIFRHFERYKEGENIEFTIKFNKENSRIEVFINNEPLEIQNFRIYNNDEEKYKESY